MPAHFRARAKPLIDLTRTQHVNDIILVTGAGGQHGGTGAHLVRRLLSQRRRVRILVRRESATTREFADAGVDVIRGDLQDRRTITPALDGVSQAYFTYPIAAGVLSAAANWSEATRRADHPIRTVVMSMAPAHPDHPSDRGRDQWLAEQVMQWAGLDVLVLKVMALFHENLEVAHASSIAHEGVMRNCFGNGRVPWVSGADAAELALAALLHPEDFTGPVAQVSGTESISHPDIAEMLARQLGRPVRFEPVDQAAWKAELLQIAGTESGPHVSVDMAHHIPAVAMTVAHAGPMQSVDPGQFERLTGRKPFPLARYLADSADRFQP
jgi:uncharacterized protein YbjT (DUF2867 family)